MSGKLSFADARGVLANPQYRRYVTGTFLSQSGDWAQRLAVGWLTWELTESPAWLGIILFCDTAPTILVSPIGGVIVDRMDRMRLSRLTVFLSMLQPLFLAVMYFAELLNVWMLVAATIYLGTVNAFGHTARLALMALLVPERDIARAAPIASISFNLARFAGPALFGVISAAASPGYAVLFNACTYVVFLAILAGLKPRDEAVARKRKGATLAGDVWEGLRYSFTHPGVGPLLIVLVVGSFGMRSFLDLLPGFASGEFGRGPEALSVMTGAVALGALTGAIYLAMRPNIIGLAPITMHASAWSGLMIIVFASVDVFWVAVATLYLVGTGMSVSAVGVMAIIQTCVKGEMRGRALSIYGIIFRGGPAVGGLAMGWIAEWTGLRWPVAGGGLLCVVAWLWILGRLGGVRRNLEQPAAGEVKGS